jgi:predicted nucleotidyltransferase component of viral defense system
MTCLSVDIDPVYLPLDNRDTALKNVRDAFLRIANYIEDGIPGSKVLRLNEETNALRIFVSKGNVQIKIELSPVLRGSVFPPLNMEVQERVEAEFGYAEVPVLSLPDLYAGKMCAALDRQHPRDLFDIKLLLENQELSQELRQTFLVYLISHNRPISELIAPIRKNIRGIFQSDFINMTEMMVTVEELESVREHLIKTLHAGITKQEKQFLLSFKACEPDWSLLDLAGIAQLPAVRWKMLNLRKMPKDKHTEALKSLKDALSFEHD